MKKTIVILIFTAIALNLQAQYFTTSEGYIITNQNDTIKGTFKDLSYKELAKYVQFKGKNDENFHKYTADSLRGFYIEPDYYFYKKTVKINRTYLEIRNEVSEYQYRFLRKATDGKVILYVFYENAMSPRFYIENDDKSLLELKKNVTVTDSKKYTDNKYLFELGKLMYDLPSIQKKINSVKFDEKGLSNLIAYYNSQFGASKNYIEKPGYQWDLQLIATFDVFPLGYDIFQVSNEDEGEGWLIGYTAGIDNYFHNPKLLHNTALHIGIHYTYYSYDQNRVITYEWLEDWYKYHQEFHMVSMPLYLEYNNRHRLISPLFEAGFAPYMSVKYEYADGELYNTEGWDFNLSFIFGAGLAFNLPYKLTGKLAVYLGPIEKASLGITYRF